MFDSFMVYIPGVFFFDIYIKFIIYYVAMNFRDHLQIILLMPWFNLKYI